MTNWRQRACGGASRFSGGIVVRGIYFGLGGRQWFMDAENGGEDCTVVAR